MLLSLITNQTIPFWPTERANEWFWWENRMRKSSSRKLKTIIINEMSITEKKRWHRFMCDLCTDKVAPITNPFNSILCANVTHLFQWWKKHVVSWIPHFFCSSQIDKLRSNIYVFVTEQIRQNHTATFDRKRHSIHQFVLNELIRKKLGI